MKPVYIAFTIVIATVLMAMANLPVAPKSSLVMEVFAGSTPCGGIIRPLHKIAQEFDCAMVEWNLTLYHDAVTLRPTTFKLTAVNRFVVKETNMYSQPGSRSQTEGKWAIVQGTKTNSTAIVYQLNPGNSTTSVSFLKLSDDLLHLLDQGANLMIGDAFFSYTLNRVAR